MFEVTPIAIVWIVLILILLLVEILTINLVTIWFVIAAIPALFLELLGVSLVVQIIVFALIATMLLIFTRPLVKKIQNGRALNTNYMSVIGQQGIALEDLGGLEKGYVKINGMEWLAQSEDNIQKDDVIVVQDVSGSKVIIKKIKK